MEIRPTILIMENVPNLVFQFKNDFELINKKIELLGYKNYSEILNAKDFGIPQNRERVFMVSIFGNYNYKFPKKKKLKLSINDLLESEIDNKYFLNNKQLISSKILDPKGICTYLDIINGDDRLPKIYLACAIRTRDKKQKIEISKNPKILNCLTTVIKDTLLTDLKYIRRLTPKECWRLMGIDDRYFEKAAHVCSETQLYKQAGNGIVINVLEAIFSELLKIKKG